MSTEKLELFKNINVRSGQHEPFSLLEERRPDSKDCLRLAGFLQNGKFSWIANDAILRVISTDTGAEVAFYNFAKQIGIDNCGINHVEEISYSPDVCIMAVSIEFFNSAGSNGGGSSGTARYPAQEAGMVSIFCVQGSKILGSMDMSEHITSCKYLEWELCCRSALRQFHGTLVIGTSQGKVFLVDLMIPNDIRDIVLSPSHDGEIFPMMIVPMSDETQQLHLLRMHRKFISDRQEIGDKSFFAIQLKQVLDDSGAIISFLCMPNLIMMAIGLDDGRMVLYDLVELNAFHLAYPPGNRAPLTHMSFIEPADDPRSAVYIWAFHSSKDGAIAVMHSVMFESRTNGYYENFRSCSVRLTMPIFVKDTFPVCCRSIMKSLSVDEEEVITINLLAWTSPSRNRTHIMIFDLNQWYKEEMPSVGDWRNGLNYTVVFEVPNIALDILLDEKSLMPFNSIMRPEEHFHPNSLNFDLVMLQIDSFAHYRWFGVQNQVLNQYSTVGPRMILEPSYYFQELLKVAISPQFYDVNFSIATPIELKREFLLSVALDYNFTGFLKRCAWAWADGSYMGKNGSVGVSLSTLTDWIWNRVLTIKDISNSLSQPLFDFSEQRIDCGTQKQLAMCCKQLKNLSELLQIITHDYRKYIPENVISQIQTQASTVKMAADYQEVLQWLLNVGLLPEGNHSREREDNPNDDFVIVPYPYRAISSHYDAQRSKFAADNENEISPLRKYLFIDAFIEHECNGDELINIWDGAYPPKSIQSLLRTLLVPDIPTEKKHVIFMYLFMDITNVLSESDYSAIVRNLIKFPAVFKINPSTIKRTQAFWNLDNGLMEMAVEELISPLSNDKFLPIWQRELLIGALLKQNATSLALRALRCPGNPIAPELEMATLLANNLLSEALKTQRASGNPKLLERFFHKTLHSSSYEQLLNLALTEQEGAILREYLNTADLSNCVNVHFVYLLQRAKFIDAAQLMESFNTPANNVNMETPKQVLNAYYSVMEPTTRMLTSMAYAEDSSIVQCSPLPLSVNLIQSRCNATNDIYKRCVQSITEATHDISEEVKEIPFIGVPKLGMFDQRSQAAQNQEVSYPMEFNEHGKRPQRDNNGIFRMAQIEGPQAKRRRIDEVLNSNKFKSFVDKRVTMLTNFKKLRTSQISFTNFTIKTPSASSRTSPERQAPLLFDNVLRTPVVEKKTPMKVVPDRAGTPHSILKTRSARSSVSPAHSRFSEMDDNKSVKSITFAAMPDTRESSLQGSSYLDESFSGADQVNSSTEIFYSPEKPDNIDAVVAVSSSSSLISGPRPRPSIKSPPKEQATEQNEKIPLLGREATAEEDEPIDPLHVIAQSTQRVFSHHTEELAEASRQDIVQEEVTIGLSSNESESSEMFKHKSVLNSDSDESSDSESDVSIPDDSIYGYVRKSVLQTTQADSSDDEEESEMPFRRQVLASSSSSNHTSEDLQIPEDEHFEEEELPEHSDYDDDSEDDDDEELAFSSDESAPKKKPLVENEVIELLDSDDDDDVQIQAPVALPAFDEVQAPPPHNQILPSFNEIETQQDIIIQEDVAAVDAIKEKDEEISELLTAENLMTEEEVQPPTEEDPMDVLYGHFEQPQDHATQMEVEREENVATEVLKEEVQPPTDENVTNVLYENIEQPQDDANQMEVDREENEDIESPQFEIITPLKAPKTPESEEKIVEPLEAIEETPQNDEAAVAAGVVEVNDAGEAAAPRDDPPTVVEEEVQTVETAKDIAEPQAEIELPTTSLPEAIGGEMNAQEQQLPEEISLDPCQTVDPFDCALIEDDSKNEETSEAFMSAASEIQVENEEEEQPVAETKTNETEIGRDVTDESENILEMAILEDDSKITEPEQSVVSQKIEEDSEMSEVTENPLEVAQIGIEVESMRAEVSEVVEKDENDKEIEDILKTPTASQEQEEQQQPDSTQTVPVDLSTPKRRRAMREESEVETNKEVRSTRAASVPLHSSFPLPPAQSRSGRAASELRHTPKVLIKKKMQESFAESPTLSGGVLTRRRSKLLSESGEATPQTPTKGSPTPSEDVDSVRRTPRGGRSSAGTPTALTSRRILTRAASKDSIASSIASSNQLQIDERAMEEIVSTPRRRGGRKKASVNSDDEGDDVKSTTSTQSTSSRKKASTPAFGKITPETSPIDELNVTNRRLTRGQLAVLEKSREFSERMASGSTLRKSVSDMGQQFSHNTTKSDDDSDNESVKSEKSARSKDSKASSRRGTRKRKLPERFNEFDTLSLASKSSRKSKSPTKKHQLSMIPEEGTETPAALERTTRGRKK